MFTLCKSEVTKLDQDLVSFFFLLFFFFFFFGGGDLHSKLETKFLVQSMLNSAKRQANPNYS